MYIVIRNITLTEPKTLEDEPTEEYDHIPSEYVPDMWPSTTNHPCYMCTIVTRRKPFFAPEGYISGRYYRGVNPAVCHPMCAVQYVYSLHLSDSVRDRMINLIVGLLEAMTGVKCIVIHPSPDRSTLIKFGGNSSEKSYQRMLINNSQKYVELLYEKAEYYHADLR